MNITRTTRGVIVIEPYGYPERAKLLHLLKMNNIPRMIYPNGAITTEDKFEALLRLQLDI